MRNYQQILPDVRKAFPDALREQILRDAKQHMESFIQPGHPGLVRGVVRWGDTVRRLRAELAVHGWVPFIYRGLEGVRHPILQVRLVVWSGGWIDNGLQTWTRGPLVKDALLANAPMRTMRLLVQRKQLSLYEMVEGPALSGDEPLVVLIASDVGTLIHSWFVLPSKLEQLNKARSQLVCEDLMAFDPFAMAPPQTTAASGAASFASAMPLTLVIPPQDDEQAADIEDAVEVDFTVEERHEDVEAKPEEET